MGTRLLAVAAAAGLMASPAAAITPGEFARAALAHSTDYRSAQAQFEGAGLGVDVARAALLPQIRGQANRQLVPKQTMPRNGPAEESRTEISAALTQTLVNINQTRTFAQARHLEQAAAYELELISQQVLLAAYNAYLDALLAKANLRALEKRKQIVGQQLLIAESSFEFGSADTTLMDELAVRAQLAEIDAEAAVAEQRLEASMLVLESMIGRRPGRLHELQEEAPLESRRDWLALAQTDALAVRASQASLDAALAAEDAVFALALPSASLAASAFNHGEETVGLRIDFPLFSSGGASAGAQRAAAQARAAGLRLEGARRQARLEIADALVRAETQQKRIRLLIATLQAQQRRLEATEVLSESGKGVTFQVIDAASDLAAAEVALVAARHSKLLAVLSLNAAIGKLDEVMTAAYDTLFAN